MILKYLPESFFHVSSENSHKWELKHIKIVIFSCGEIICTLEKIKINIMNIIYAHYVVFSLSKIKVISVGVNTWIYYTF